MKRYIYDPRVSHVARPCGHCTAPTQLRCTVCRRARCSDECLDAAGCDAECCQGTLAALPDEVLVLVLGHTRNEQVRASSRRLRQLYDAARVRGGGAPPIRYATHVVGFRWFVQCCRALSAHSTRDFCRQLQLRVEQPSPMSPFYSARDTIFDGMAQYTGDISIAQVLVSLGELVYTMTGTATAMAPDRIPYHDVRALSPPVLELLMCQNDTESIAAQCALFTRIYGPAAATNGTSLPPPLRRLVFMYHAFRKHDAFAPPVFALLADTIVAASAHLVELTLARAPSGAAGELLWRHAARMPALRRLVVTDSAVKCTTDLKQLVVGGSGIPLQVRELVLRNVWICVDDMDVLGRTLGAMTRLTLLDLSENWLRASDALWPHFSPGSMPHLETLMLCNTSLGQRGTALMLRALAAMPHLRTLDLAKADIATAQGQGELQEPIVLATVIQEQLPRTLRTLKLGDNGMLSEQVEALLAALVQRGEPALHTLFIGGNSLTPHTRSIIARLEAVGTTVYTR